MKIPIYQNETCSVLSLAFIFACRMMGLFMMLPIFSQATAELASANASLIGLALGVYGLTQAIFQIPLGILSDRVGRKPVIIAGLLLLLVGSLVGMCASSIYGVIIGRAIQGAGAIGSVILALLADVTKVENRTTAMGVVGMSIGCSFMLAMLLGPIIYEMASLKGLFSVMAILALLALIILKVGVHHPSKRVLLSQLGLSQKFFDLALLTPELMRLNLGILIQHAILTASFMAIPGVFSHILGLSVSQYWMFYLPVLLLAFLGAFPLIILSEKKRFIRGALLVSVATLAITQIALSLFHNTVSFVATVLSIFFFAFTLLEAFLPSLVSKMAPIHAKGSAMGIYSTAQFLGIFLGGSMGGVIFTYFGANGVFLGCGMLAALWLLGAIKMKSPPYLSTRMYSVPSMTAEEARVLSQQFLSAKGVSEVSVIPSEGAILLKIDRHHVDEMNLKKIVDLFQSSFQYASREV